MIDQTDTWQWKALQLLKGNTTLSGSIVLAIKPLPRWPSKLANQAKIAKDGSVVTGYRSDPSTEDWAPTFRRVGMVDDLTRSFSVLADDLRLPDDQRIEMFKALRAWIVADERELPEALHFTKGEITVTREQLEVLKAYIKAVVAEAICDALGRDDLHEPRARYEAEQELDEAFKGF